jgi:hypothetical protein
VALETTATGTSRTTNTKIIAKTTRGHSGFFPGFSLGSVFAEKIEFS